MIRFARDFRLIPIVLLATISLFALKVSGLIFDGGYTLAERMQARTKPSGMQVTTAESVPDYPKITIADQNVISDTASAGKAPAKPWAQAMFGYNDTAKGDVTGSVGEKNEEKKEEKKEDKKDEKPAAGSMPTSEKRPDPPKLEVGGTAYPLEQGKINSPGERAVLERLQDRREALDSRGRDLEMRENLLKAAEKRVEAKVAELKDVEARVNTAMGNRDQAELQRFKSIVSMYENMKGKDAARIFDRLDLKILVDVATQMNPRKMSEILALMSSEGAERLTVELANRASANPKPLNADQLPKIDGKPNGG